MWDFLSQIGGALKRPVTELPKAKMPDIGAIKPQLAGGGSVGPQGPAPIPTNDTQLGGKVQYNGPQHPDFVPNLGRPGPVRQPWSPEAEARNDWVMERAQRDEGGAWTGKIKRDWKDMLSNAMLGYSQAYQGSGGNAWAGLGGAMAGGAGAAISPMAGRNYSFDQAVRPQMIEDQTRQAEQDRMRMEGEMQRARIGEIQARTAEAPLDRQEKLARIKQIEGATRDAGATREWQQAQIDLMRARQEAAETGQPKFVSAVNPVTGKAEQKAIWPDGTEVILGGDVKSDIAGKNVQSREKVAADRNATGIRRTAMAQSGATGRTIISQKGQNERLQTRLGAEGAATAAPAGGGGAKVGGKVASMQDVSDYAGKKGISIAEARKKFENSGYSIR